MFKVKKKNLMWPEDHHCAQKKTPYMIFTCSVVLIWEIV